MRRDLISLFLVGGLAVSGCTGIAFSKAGEEDARSACQELLVLNDNDELTAEDVLYRLGRAEAFAAQAVEANDDYEELDEAIKAFNELLMITPEDDLVQGGWERIARACNDF